MTLELFGPSRSAVISDCGHYRYRLDRSWGDGDRICWVMLNPSTADANEDDPTLRRVIGFSQRWGYGSLVVVNLFAYRATNPSDLPSDSRAIGPLADSHMNRAIHESTMVVCGWGNSVTAKVRRERESAVVAMVLEAGLQPNALGLTRCGAPRHPLYMRGDARPILLDFRADDRLA